MIDFPQREALVAQAQRILRLKPDGLDGPVTWAALVTRFISPAAVIALGIPPRGGRAFIGRRTTVSAVQRVLGASVDGRDGEETWGAIMAQLAPLPSQPVPPPNPGTRYPEVVRGRTPNRNAGTNTCEGIVFHHCAGTFEGTISWVLKAGTNAAYHCLIGQDGRRAILAHDSDRVHHAGVSSFRGRSGCNAYMLGVSFTGNTNTGARRPHPQLTADEIASAHEWVAEKRRLYNIPAEWITHHRVVSPGRKDDISLEAWSQLGYV
jgi:AmpD protein